MSQIETPRRPGRPARVSRDQVLRAAIAIADADGLGAVTMQRVGRALAVESMSLYRHVENKDDLLDGLVDLVYEEIALPPTDVAWKAAMRARAISARDVLVRHPWAIAVMESRIRPGPANLAHHEAVVACLFAAGFTATTATRAYNLLDSYIYGFALQQKQLPFDATADLNALPQEMLQDWPAGRYPHLEMVAEEMFASGFVYADEFEHGLDLILDGLERDHRADSRRRSQRSAGSDGPTTNRRSQATRRL
jgi:AcrR family transcriptional regulator